MEYKVTDVTSAANFWIIGYAATYEEAKGMIPGEIAFIEEDQDFPDHFDAINRCGFIYTIEPVPR